MSQWTPEDAEKIRKAMDSAKVGFDKVFEDIAKVTDNIREGFEKLSGNKVSEWQVEAMRKYCEHDVMTAWDSLAEHKGPSPHKGGYCGFCATATDKEQRKLDSCPQCGKSYMKYGRK